LRGAVDGASSEERVRVGRATAEAVACIEDLKRRCDKELGDAG